MRVRFRCSTLILDYLVGLLACIGFMGLYMFYRHLLFSGNICFIELYLLYQVIFPLPSYICFIKLYLLYRLIYFICLYLLIGSYGRYRVVLLYRLFCFIGLYLFAYICLSVHMAIIGLFCFNGLFRFICLYTLSAYIGFIGSYSRYRGCFVLSANLSIF